MANINEILARAAALRDETALNSISPERAGGIMYDTLLALNELWLQQGSALVISKIYASVAAMEADSAPVSDLTGQPLRPGQIVVIASSDSDNGSVYRYNGIVNNASSWTLVGAIGNLDPVDSLDSDSTTLPLAAHQGKVLDGKISQLGQEVVKTIGQELLPSSKRIARNNISVANDIYGSRANYIRKATISNGNILTLDGSNVTDFIPCVNGATVVWRFGGTGATNIRIEYFNSDKGFLEGGSCNGFVDTRTITVSNANIAYIRVAFHSTMSDGSQIISPISVNGVDFLLIDNENGFVKYVKDGDLEDELRWKPIPLGSLLNCDTNSSGNLSHSTTYDPLRVTTVSNVCMPFPGMKIRARIPDNLPYILTFYLWIGNAASGHSLFSIGTQNPFIFFDGSEATLPKTALTIRPVFRARTTSAGSWVAPILAQDIQSMIDNGSLALEYYDDTPDDVFERNKATLANLSAIRRVLLPTLSENGMDSMPVFAHITDLHGDVTRWKNYLDYCDKVGVDFALNTGDSVMAQKKDNMRYIYDFAISHDTDIIAAIGNHEASPTGSGTMFADYLSDLASKYGYLASDGTATDKCYYYKDYDVKKTRVIVLNQHEDGVYARRIGQDQIIWFIATLLSTPAGYGIVIAYHAPEDKVVVEAPYDVFRQPLPNTGATYEPNGAYVGERVISKIVDALIVRGSVDFTYNDHSATYNGDDDLSTQIVSVVADFSGVDASTEFICYVCGHRHEDWIGYYDHATEKQLCLCVTCGNALYADATNPYWSNQSDLPRGGRGVSQDAFCVYAIDRLNGNVKVMRVGATVTQMMVKRDMMVIPYKD